MRVRIERIPENFVGLRVVVVALLVSSLALGLSAEAQEVPQVRPDSVTVPADGGRASFSMFGTGLGLFGSIGLVPEEGASTDGITIAMGRPPS